MKKILMLVMLIFPVWVFGGVNSHPLVQENNVILPNLEFKTIFRELYAGKMRNTFYSDEDTEDEIKLPHVGIEPDKDKNDRMAFLHPIIHYINFKGEPRFLVPIEIVKLTEGSLQNCHACFAETNLFLFSKEANGYKLLSSSGIKTKEDIYGGWGRSNFGAALANSVLENPVKLNIDEDSEKPQELVVERIGINKEGLFYKSDYMQHGFASTALHIIVLNEDTPILNDTITTISEDGSSHYAGESPLAYSYEGKYSLDETEINKSMYPIKIVFKGEAPTNLTAELSKSNKIRPYNEVKYFCFNNKKNEYQESKTRDCFDTK